jgi:hypothetical protein
VAGKKGSTSACKPAGKTYAVCRMAHRTVYKQVGKTAYREAGR